MAHDSLSTLIAPNCVVPVGVERPRSVQHKSGRHRFEEHKRDIALVFGGRRRLVAGAGFEPATFRL